MTTDKTKKSKTYVDHNGNEIPSNFIHKIDRDKHSAALRFHKKAVKLSNALKEFKAELMQEGDNLFERTAEEKKVNLRSNAKGGYSLMTIDKKVKVQVSISESIRFNDNIDLAQVKIREYLDKVTEGSNEEVHLLIDQAFKTRKGQLDTARVLGLLKLNISNPTWIEAMELIKQSIEQNNSKRYVQIFEKDENGEYQSIKMDFAGM